MVLWPYCVITCVTWGIFFDKLSISLDCCITGLWHPINRNYVFKNYPDSTVSLYEVIIVMQACRQRHNVCLYELFMRVKQINFDKKVLAYVQCV